MIKVITSLVIGICIGWFAQQQLSPKPPITIAPSTPTTQLSCPETLTPPAQPIVQPPTPCPEIAVAQSTIEPAITSTTVEDALATQRVETYQAIADAYVARDWLTIINLSNEIGVADIDNWGALLATGHAQLSVGNYELGLQLLNRAYMEQSTFEVTDSIDRITNAVLNSFTDKQRAKRIAFLRWLTNYQSERLDYWYELAESLVREKDFDAAEAAIQTISGSPQYHKEAMQMTQHIERLRAMASQRYAEVPLVKHGDHYLVLARINQSVELTLLLDTGASLTSISPSTVEALNINISHAPELRLMTANGAVQAKQLVLSTMELGDSLLPNVPVGVIDLDSPHFDGLLGMSYLNYFDFYIDQHRHKLHLSPK